MVISIKWIPCTVTLGISECPQNAKPLSTPMSFILSSTVHGLLWGLFLAGFSLCISRDVSLLRSGQKLLLSCLCSLPVLIPARRHFPSHLQEWDELSTIAIIQALLNLLIVRVEWDVIVAYEYLSHLSSFWLFIYPKRLTSR